MALRYGTRAEGMRGQSRIPNAPSFQDGIAICLSRPMHYGLHGALNVALAAEGKQTSVKGTALIDDIADQSIVSIDAIPHLDPACKALAREKVQQQMFPIGEQPGRTTITLPDSAARVVLQRGFY